MKKKFKAISNTEDGLLSKLFREILNSTGKINTIIYDVNKYVKRGGSKVKSSVLKNVIDGEMTWKSFIFLLFDVLKFKKIVLKITLTHDSGIETEHELVVTPKKENKVK